MKTFILIAGKMISGKSTTAQYLACRLNGNVRSFAGKLKDIARQMLWDGKKDERGRKLLQSLGKIGREYDVDLWAKLLVESAKYDDITIIDDWRFPNEKEVCEKYGNVITVRVYRDSTYQYNSRELTEDESETSLSNDANDYDFVVFNNGNLEDLYSSLENIIPLLTKRINVV